MRVGVFTALLAQLSLDDVLKKLKTIHIDTVELGTGNYPGDPHCKLSMLEDKAERNEFKQKLADNGVSHQRAELPWQSAAPRSGAREARSGSQPQDDPAGREAGCSGGYRFFRLPGR